MERFSYPSLAAARAESTEILYLMECEYWGRGKDDEERLAEQQRKYSTEGGE